MKRCGTFSDLLVQALDVLAFCNLKSPWGVIMLSYKSITHGDFQGLTAAINIKLFIVEYASRLFYSKVLTDSTLILVFEAESSSSMLYRTGYGLHRWSIGLDSVCSWQSAFYVDFELMFKSLRDLVHALGFLFLSSRFVCASHATHLVF